MYLSSKWSQALLVIFFATWLYTEVSEYFSRSKFVEEIESFMHHGERFSAEEGRELSDRLDKLEEK